MGEDPISGWGLRSVELTDQATISAFFTSLSEPLSDYTFSQIYTWRNSLRLLWRIIDAHLCVFANGTGDLTLLLPPIGDGNSDKALAGAFELMNDYNASHHVPDRSRIEYASQELLSRFDKSRLLVEPMGTDYIYDTARMIDLAGGDLASKRQAKNRFLRTYAHRVEPYCAEKHLAGCRALLEEWKSHQDAQHVNSLGTHALKRQKEYLATELSLEHSSALGLSGLVVYVDDAIRGFTFGEPLGRDQASIVIEKTDLQIKGLAQFIFSEFTRLNWAHRPLINAGDDWGLETLAWTKQSYRPVKLLQKFALRQDRAALVFSSAVLKTEDLREGTEIVQAHSLTIRAARPGDLEPVFAMENACFTTYRLKQRQLNYLQKSPKAIFRVAEQDGTIVGDAIALVRRHRNSAPSGRIYSLAVHPDYRGQKIGLKLLQNMLEELSKRQVRRVYLEVESTNLTAIKLYEANGFSAVGTLPDYYGQGRSGLRMMFEMPMAANLSDTDRRAA